jgi:hypothetical protein
MFGDRAIDPAGAVAILSELARLHEFAAHHAMAAKPPNSARALPRPKLSQFT